MALTKISGSVIQQNNFSVGVVTASNVAIGTDVTINSSGINVTGFVTAVSGFSGPLTGNVTGTATTATTLSGTPNLNVGVVTANSFYGDASNLTGIPAGLGTALSQDQSSSLNQLYYTNKILSVGSTITVDPPSSSNIAYTQYAEIAVEEGYDLIVEDGDDLVPDILGLSTETAGVLAGAGGRVRADNFTNKAGTGAPTFPNGVNVTGVLTATSFSGDGSALTGIDATSLKDSGDTIRVQANTSGAVVTGVLTATSFSGDLTGTASTATAATTAYGLSGSPTLSGITSVSTTNLTVNGNAYPSTGPLSNRNLIINGAMQVAQRGTQVTGETSGGYLTCDRFQFIVASLGTWTVTQSTDSPDGFSNSFKLDCTTANASPASNANLFVKYKIEAQDLQHLKYGTSSAETMTLSFWVKSNKTGDASIDLRQNDNSNKLYTLGYNISAADTWEQKVLTITGDTAGVINNDNGNGLEIDWWLNSGSNFTGGAGPSNSWFASDETRRNFDNFGLGGSTDDEFYITGVQLEVGTVATPFEHRSYADELRRCQRYFRRYCEGSTGKMSPCFVIGNSASTAYGNLNLSPSMRIVPSSDFDSIKVDNVGSPKSITAVSVSANSSNDSLFLTFTVASGITYPTPYFILANGVTTARLDFSAEL